jgi:hypothetical protein
MIFQMCVETVDGEGNRSGEWEPLWRAVRIGSDKDYNGTCTLTLPMALWCDAGGLHHKIRNESSDVTF